MGRNRDIADDEVETRDDGRVDDVVTELQGCDGGCGRMLDEDEEHKVLIDSEGDGEKRVVCLHCWEDLTRGMIEE